MSRMTTLQKKSRTKARHANKRAAKAVSPVAADARDAAVRYADATRDWAAPKVETAVDWAAPKVDTAKDWAAPKVEPAVDKVKSDVLPAVAGAVTTALAATEPARAEAANRGSAALAALKGEVDPPKAKKHRVRKLFLLATVLGAGLRRLEGLAGPQQRPGRRLDDAGHPGRTGRRTGRQRHRRQQHRDDRTDDPAGAEPGRGAGRRHRGGRGRPHRHRAGLQRPGEEGLRGRGEGQQDPKATSTS